MKQLDILLPYSTLPADLYRSLVHHIEASALAQLLGYGKTITTTSCASRTTLPEERWLAQQFNLPYQEDQERFSPALAHILMAHFNIPVTDGHWFIVQPSHFNVGMNQITLTPYTQIDLTDSEAQALFSVAQTLCAEHGVQLYYGDRHFWFLKADDWSELSTTSPAVIQGNGIDSGLPVGAHARDWRKLHNEIQMSWFSHSVNEARENANLLPMNGLWLWGASHHHQTLTFTPYQTILTSQLEPHNALQRAIGAQFTAQLPTHFTDKTLCIINDLMPAYLEEDWGLWLDTLTKLDNQWFLPCLNALKNKHIDKVRFIMTDLHQITEYEAGLKPSFAFWKKPSLKALQS